MPRSRRGRKARGDHGITDPPRSRQASQGGGRAYLVRRGCPGGQAVGRGHGRRKARTGSDQTLAEFAQAQVRADLLDDAAQVIAVLLDESQTSAQDWQASAALDPAWQAVTALVAALAERGDMARAITALQMIPDFAHSYPRAVRALARAIAGTDVTEAERLAGLVQRPGWTRLRACRSRCSCAGRRISARCRPRGRRDRAAPLAGTGARGSCWRAGAGGPHPGRQGPRRDRSSHRCRGQCRPARRVRGDTRHGGTPAAPHEGHAGWPARHRTKPGGERWPISETIAAQAGLNADAREAFTAAQRAACKRQAQMGLRVVPAVPGTAQRRRHRRRAGNRCDGPRRAARSHGRHRLWSAVARPTAPPAARADRPSQPRTSVPDPALDPAIAAAEAAADIPMAVAALAAIARAIGELRDRRHPVPREPSSANGRAGCGDEPARGRARSSGYSRRPSAWRPGCVMRRYRR